MYQGPFKLHDIIHKDGKDILEVIDIVYKPDNRFKHSLNITEHPIGSGSIESCKEQNDKQLTFLLECRENVESRLRANKRSPKIKNLLEYYASSYDQYFNWYTGKRKPLPRVSPGIVHVKNKFASNWNFSVVKLDNKVYQLTKTQSKIVEYAFKQLDEDKMGLTYSNIVNGVSSLGGQLTNYSRLSSYFQKELKVTTLFRLEKGRYHLITD